MLEHPRGMADWIGVDVGKATTCGHEPYKAKGLCVKCYQAQHFRKWSEANSEARKAYKRAWYAKNKARQAETARAWQEANPDYNRRRYVANRAFLLAQSRAWVKSNPDARREIDRRRRAAKRNVNCELTLEHWRMLLRQFNDACFYCGRDDLRLVQEHMMPLSRGGAHTAANIVPSCGPCNNRKYTKTAEEFLGLV